METRVIESPTGRLMLQAHDGCLVRLSFAPTAKIQNRPHVAQAADRRVLSETTRQLNEYFAGTRTRFDLPLAYEGTEFQQAVWDALRDIPYGQVESYGQLAARIGRPKSARAVGQANHNNPIAIVIPCHRVIGQNGKLTGFGGGLDCKRLLLDLESGVTSGHPEAARFDFMDTPLSSAAT